MSSNIRSKKVSQEPRWEWNLPLLLRTFGAVGVIAIFGLVLYFWQSSSMASELLAQADGAKQRGENSDRVKWLSRYVRLVPSDVESQAELAFAVDSQEIGQKQNVEFARSRLTAALVASGSDPEFDELRKKLRRKLVPRLLQLGTSKATEAEEQIILLSAEPNDAEVEKWLAKSLLLQRSISEYRDRDPEQYDKGSDFWKWLASQPTGKVLEQALASNPNDVDLMSNTLVVCSQHPEWFESRNEPVPKKRLEELVAVTLERLSKLKEDGHAQFILYFYTLRSDAPKASAVLTSVLDGALTRIKNFAVDSRIKHEDRSLADFVPYWDWQIALEGSRVANTDEAERICEQLIEFANERIDIKQREQTYLRLAGLKIEKNEHDKAIDVCRSGLASIKQSPSLNRLIAIENLRMGKTSEASKAIDEIEHTTELRLKQTDGAQGVGLSTSEKIELRQQIAQEQWIAKLLRGQLLIAEGEYAKAEKLLKEAFETTIPIPAENRVEAGQLLAACYSQSNQWDLAGEVYDKCAGLSPNDRSISFNAVRAWRRAGSADRANAQIGKIDDGSFAAALEQAYLIGSKPASKIEKRSIGRALKAARERLEVVPEQERASLEPWRLELLELRFGSDDTKTAKEQESDTLSKLETLAQKYADIGEVQAQAALDLALFGRIDAANLAIGRLEKIADRTRAINDQTNLILTKSSVLVITKDSRGALSLLLNAIKSKPERALRFAKAAAQIAIRSNNVEEAYDCFNTIPDEELDFESFVTLAGIADNLRDTGSSKADELSQKLEMWTDKLKQVEGTEGTNWRYLAAERLVSNSTALLTNQKSLEQAEAYYKEIDALRPHWGLGSALGGRIASIKARIEGQPRLSEEAISLWRRAIRDGDNRISTTLDLVRELNFVKRVDEAELELKNLSGLADSVVPISAMAVSFAIKRGDFSEAITRSEQLTLKNPDDVDGWLLRAQTSFAASSSLGLDEPTRKKLLDDSWSFLEKAKTLSHGRNVGVWNAQFRFKVLSNDKEGASLVIEEMLKETAIPEESRMMNAGQFYLTLKEYGLARKYFESAMLLNSRSPEAHLGLAELNAAIGDTEQTLSSLRKAHQVAPRNADIRDRLALSLAFLNSETPDKIFWTEIDSLLASTVVPKTPRSAIVGAFIALNKGDEQRQSKALEALHEIAQSSSAERIDAKRMLANHFAMQWVSKATAEQLPSTIEDFETARRLYDELLEEVSINPVDASRYVSLLLKASAISKETGSASNSDYLSAAELALSKLESSTGSSIASLQLGVRLAEARDEVEKIGSVADKWVDNAGNLETLGSQILWEITGQTLLQLGHPRESIVWLEKAYEKDPKKYSLLAAALAKEGSYDKAIELCKKAYRSEPSAMASTLIAEIAMMRNNTQLDEDAAQILKEALTKFSDSPELLEVMGTMQLMQSRHQEAVTLFEMAEAKAPKRRTTLNNLAMALSEIPIRKKEALGKIEKAIEIYGRDPDLLDTLGQVQFRNGRLEEGLATLTEACRIRDDVSFRLHLVQILVAMKDMTTAKEQWRKVKQKQLDGLVLTPEDKDLLALLNSQLGEKL